MEIYNNKLLKDYIAKCGIKKSPEHVELIKGDVEIVSCYTSNNGANESIYVAYKYEGKYCQGFIELIDLLGFIYCK